jgi:hypothetical protein
LVPRPEQGHKPAQGDPYFANLGLITAGIYLLFVQLHGYQHDTNAELFRFPVEEHIHIHEDMEIQNATTSPRNSL